MVTGCLPGDDEDVLLTAEGLKELKLSWQGSQHLTKQFNRHRPLHVHKTRLALLHNSERLRGERCSSDSSPDTWLFNNTSHDPWWRTLAAPKENYCWLCHITLFSFLINKAVCVMLFTSRLALAGLVSVPWHVLSWDYLTSFSCVLLPRLFLLYNKWRHLSSLVSLLKCILGILYSCCTTLKNVLRTAGFVSCL